MAGGDRRRASLRRYRADAGLLPKEDTAQGGRTVCRRAGRSLVELGKAENINEQPRQYVNRLSDRMFVLSRVLNRFAGGSDVLWQHERKRK